MFLQKSSPLQVFRTGHTLVVLPSIELYGKLCLQQ